MPPRYQLRINPRSLLQHLLHLALCTSKNLARCMNLAPGTKKNRTSRAKEHLLNLEHLLNPENLLQPRRRNLITLPTHLITQKNLLRRLLWHRPLLTTPMTVLSYPDTL